MKLFLVVIGLFFALSMQGIGQVPQRFSYQAVLRNTDGSVMSNQPINVKISLRKASASGDIVYTETQNVTTSGQGLIALSIGGGNEVDFALIPWSNNIFIQVEVKKTTEVTYQNIGTTQILSVPYALQAGNVKEVNSLSNANSDDPIFEVKNKDGKVVFGVYQGGVRIYVDDSQNVKGAKGGFAVGGLTNQGKGLPVEYMHISPDSARIYINDGFTKGAKGGFAIGGLTNQSKSTRKDYFKVTKDSSYFSTTLLTTADIISTGRITTGAGTPSDKLVDIEGNGYRTIKIGSQVWMMDNLKSTKYSDGSPINSDSLTIYDNSVDPMTLSTYGRLYAGNALLLQSRNICPDGWHVPSTADWDSLFTFVGGPYYLQTPIITGLKLMETGTITDGKGYWNNDNRANNASGFSGRPAGFAFPSISWMYSSIGDSGYWWGLDTYLGGFNSLNGIQLNGSNGEISTFPPTSTNAYSIRCVKGTPVLMISK